MSDPLKHRPTGAQPSHQEWESEDLHYADGQTTGDLLYFNGTQWVRTPDFQFDGTNLSLKKNTARIYFGTPSEFSIYQGTYDNWLGGVAHTFNALTFNGVTDDVFVMNQGHLIMWNETTFGAGPPANPADTNMFSLAVYGDAIFGDHITWTEPVPDSGTFAGLQLGRRVGNPITDITKQTQIWSNKALAEDINGGAFIQLTPDAAGAVNSGTLVLAAYGRGSGSTGNCILMKTRSGTDTIAVRATVSSSVFTLADGMDFAMNGTTILDDTGTSVTLQNITDIWSNGVVYLSSNGSLDSATDLVKIGGYDLSPSNRTLAIATETAVADEGAPLTNTKSLTIRINGVSYKLMLAAAA